jgi:hypothetical protein
MSKKVTVEPTLLADGFDEVFAILDTMDLRDGWVKLRDMVADKTEEFGTDWLRFELWKVPPQPLLLSDGYKKDFELLAVRVLFRKLEDDAEKWTALAFALNEEGKVCGIVTEGIRFS